MTIGLSILGIMATVTTSAMTSVMRRTDLRAATGHVRNILDNANTEGQNKGAYRGVKFTLIGDEWFYTVYEDGNGNGVLTEDINHGIDVRIEGPRRLFDPATRARVGFPPGGIADPDGGAHINEDARALRFGESDICSFSDFGSCTPGTIYLTDGVSAEAMVRCSGSSDQIRVEFYGFPGKWSY